MRGNPKFNLGDKVQFELNGCMLSGVIYIVDAYGTFENPSDASYDIYVESENCLYKHITESSVTFLSK